MQQPDETFRLANLIVLESRWEETTRRHTSLLCWNIGASPVHHVANNGTCCLVNTKKQRLLVTCAHVWDGFECYRSTHNGTRMWISLVADDSLNAPSFPALLSNPKLLAKDDSLDLATITFDEIDSLDGRRFYNLMLRRPSQVRKGDIVHFLGYPGDAIREGNQNLVLYYFYSSQTIHDVGQTRFVLHSEKGEIHHEDKLGKATVAVRAGGVSGAPVFKVRPDFGLELVGIVSRLCSSGLSGGEQLYEMSDGDVFVTYVHFIQDDGSIVFSSIVS